MRYGGLMCRILVSILFTLHRSTDEWDHVSTNRVLIGYWTQFLPLFHHSVYTVRRPVSAIVFIVFFPSLFSRCRCRHFYCCWCRCTRIKRRNSRLCYCCSTPYRMWHTSNRTYHREPEWAWEKLYSFACDIAVKDRRIPLRTWASKRM